MFFLSLQFTYCVCAFILNMANCRVSGCVNRKQKGCDVRFFEFPKDTTRRNTWTALAGCGPLLSSANYICSVHFEDNAYRTQDVIMKTPRIKWKLSPSALPSLQLPAATVQLETPLGSKRKRMVSECLLGLEEGQKSQSSMETQTT